MSKIPNFVPFHCHINSFDAASNVEKFSKKETELGTGHITVTDHGTLEGARRVYDFCHKETKGLLKPIIGLEAYFRDDDCPIFLEKKIEKDDKGTYKEYVKYMHLTMHFQDQKAFSAASRVLSLADDNAEHHGSERKPLFNWKNLEELSSFNVTFGSGCLIGMIGRHLLKNKDFDSAIKYYEKLRYTVGPEKFFVEVFPHVCDRDYQVGIYFKYEDGTEEKFPNWKKVKTEAGEFKTEQIANEFKDKFKAEKRHQHVLEVMTYRKWEPNLTPKRIVDVEKREGFLYNECSEYSPNGDVQLSANKFLIGLAERYGDKILLSDDSHFAYPEEKIIQDIRLNQRELEQGLSGSWIFPNSHHRLSSLDAKAYLDKHLPSESHKLEQWVDNSYEWASKFDNFKFENKQTLPTSFYPKDTLKHTLDIISKNGRMDWSNVTMTKRLEAEIDLLHKNGTIDLLPYFFIDTDVCELYLKNGQLTGPGRGSAAGLLLSYLLGITHVDPLKYSLSMDRFMTVERIKSGKLPDIDQDLPHRDLLVNPEDNTKGWLKERFGDCVAQISTETTLKLKSSIKDVFRAMHGEVPYVIEQLTKELPTPPQGIPDKDFVYGYDANGEWVPGLLETNEKILKFTKDYPKEWASIKELLGLVRQRGRHACFPASEKIFTKGNGLLEITKCGGKSVYTGQSYVVRPGRFAPNGQATLLAQGEREVVEYQLDTGKTIRCTPDHKVLTVQGWMEIQEAAALGIDLKPAANRIPLLEVDAEGYAKQRGGSLKEWQGVSKYSLWECSQGHQWRQSFGTMFSYEYWCRECSHTSRFKPTKKYVSIERSSGKCLSTYRRYDKARNFICDLTIEDVIRAKSSLCIYCTRQATGFERIDNSLGHTQKNCVPACLRCNWMRGSYISHEVMLQVGLLLKEIDP